MLRFLADENFDHRILKGARRKKPDFDCLCAQDVGLLRTADQAVLAWAAKEGRPVLTHDVNTMVAYAYERVAAGLSMPGLFIAPEDILLGEIIDSIVLVAECSLEGEWEGRVEHLPLKR